MVSISLSILRWFRGWEVASKAVTMWLVITSPLFFPWRGPDHFDTEKNCQLRWSEDQNLVCFLQVARLWQCGWLYLALFLPPGEGQTTLSPLNASNREASQVNFSWKENASPDYVEWMKNVLCRSISANSWDMIWTAKCQQSILVFDNNYEYKYRYPFKTSPMKPDLFIFQ
jgi:hypothetical protein